MAPFQGKYYGYNFTFRGCDLSALKEVFIDQEYEFLKDILTTDKPPVILDVGAHIGTFSLWALKTNPKAQIISVEASPNTFKIVNDTAQKTQKNWKVINRAAWKNTDSIAFSDDGESMSHKVLPEGKKMVQGIPLSELAKDDIDLMKIDIEGAEEAFLSQNHEALENVACLVIELHPNYCDTDKVREVINKYYPNVEEVQGRISNKPLLLCTK